MKTSRVGDCMALTESGSYQAAAAFLHVLVVPSLDGGFVAQGIEIDYVASGASEEEAREHFAQGFSETVMAYLRMGRSLSGLFKTATPPEYREAYFARSGGDMFVCAVGIEKSVLPAHAPIPEKISFITAQQPLAA